MSSALAATSDATLTRNILRVWRRATAADLEAGRDWYAVARAIAWEISPHDVARGAGIIAAMSPRLQWTANVRAARACAAGRPFGGLPDNVAKAAAIRDGAAPLDVLGGHKVRAFYAGILSAGRTDAVCVDMHAHDIAVGRVTGNADRGALSSAGNYARVADAYRRAARIASRESGAEISPAVLQAATWVAWRATTFAAHATARRSGRAA